MEKYVPNIITDSIFSVDYKQLYKNNIRFILYDLDNTITPYNKLDCDNKTKELFQQIKKIGITPIIFSNSPRMRIKKFAKLVDLEYVFLACKPLSFKFIKAMKKYGFNENETAIIGDQLLTDVQGGNKVGITTILVKPLVEGDSIFTKRNRRKEKKIKEELGIDFNE